MDPECQGGPVPARVSMLTLSQKLHRFVTACLLVLAGAPALCEQVTLVDRDAHYPEGPLWQDGKLLYVEYSANNIKSWDGKHNAVIWHRGGCGAGRLIPR